ncbi:MAG: response regulator [Candidatus Omnitrophica bacterium]|nr:response regulator [Candidatus Omnitrophota bacterium]
MKVKRKILIIDDDDYMRKAIVRILRPMQDCVFFEAKDVDSAITILDETNPDLLIVDINMPEKKGYEICLYINDKPCFAHTKVIGISGYAGGIGDAIMTSLGADYYFSKPFDTNKFLSKITMLLEEPT